MPRYQVHLRRALLATLTIDAQSESMARTYVNSLAATDVEWEVELPKQIVGVDVIDNPEE